MWGLGTDNLHSALVAWLKILLPLAALAVLSTLFMVSRSVDPADAIPYAQVDIEDRLRDPRLTDAIFAGMTQDGTAVSWSGGHLECRGGNWAFRQDRNARRRHCRPCRRKGAAGSSGADGYPVGRRVGVVVQRCVGPDRQSDPCVGPHPAGKRRRGHCQGAFRPDFSGSAGFDPPKRPDLPDGFHWPRADAISAGLLRMNLAP
jgi:hypothetical protein